MENAGYATLSRQTGLMNEMQIVANNIANAVTTGYRQEGLIFSEYVREVDNGASLSMGFGNTRNTSFEQGTLTETGGIFDFAIEGDAFFLLETPDGDRLTRAGSFARNAAGDLVNQDGYRVLDAGGAPVFIPFGVQILVAGDGTISANENPIGQIGLVVPNDPNAMVREGGVTLRADAGFVASATARVKQGFVENSNVNVIGQLARMIEVQRAYELGASFLESEDERVRQAISSLTK